MQVKQVEVLRKDINSTYSLKNNNSEFSQWLLENGHSFGNISNMDILQFSKKGIHMDTTGKLYIIKNKKMSAK